LVSRGDFEVFQPSEVVKVLAAAAAAPLDVRKACGFPASGPASMG
jgi:hypothetical protein